MPIQAREEPFAQVARFVSEKRTEYADVLCRGQWESESSARELVGSIKALEEVYEKMRIVSGPGTHFGEKDL